MRRKSSIPFGETTILSLLNMTSNTKFMIVCKVQEITDTKIIVTDGHEELDFSISGENLEKLAVEDVVIVFGEKVDSEVRKKHILKSSLNWDHYLKTRELETR